MSGGTFANVRLNQRISEIPGVDGVFVHPDMGDGGLSVGGALLSWASECSRRGRVFLPFELDHVLLGPQYDDDAIRSAFERGTFAFERHEKVESVVAEMLHAGKVVGHFNGRMEYGPRALGNRSILVEARDVRINDILNTRLRRTEFMPFAPIIMEAYADEYFHLDSGLRHPSRFMTITCNVKQVCRDVAPAVCHVDGTARPQVVSQERNPKVHGILERYYERSGIPLLINTSFNTHEEPIVGRPEDALRSLESGAIDALCIGNYLVKPHACGDVA